VGHAEIVGMDHEEPGIRGMSQALLQRRRGGIRRRSQQQAKE
jgi:hypothetical protein